MKGRRIAGICTFTISLSMLPSGSAAQVLVPRVLTSNALPDLTVATVAAPAKVVPTVSFSLSVTGRNAGRAQVSGSWTVGVYLSSDSIVDIRDTPVGTPIVVPGSIDVGSVASVSIPVALPASTLAGMYYVGVVLDPANALAESNDANNARGDRVEVYVPAAPNVINTVPANASLGAVSSTITFNGIGFETQYFRATLGGRPLRINAGGTSSSITATLPGTAVIGDLIVSHTVPSSDYKIRSGFIVYGKPSIASASPTSFRSGQSVTLTGSGLFEFNVWPTTWNNDGNKYVDIGSTEMLVAGSSRVRVTNWQVSPDGSSLTFVAREVWTSKDGVHVPASPQPTSAIGPIRLRTSDPAQDYTLSSPSVTWMPAPLSILSYTYPRWEANGNSVTPPWVMTNFNNTDYAWGRLLISGTSLTELTATIGGTAVTIGVVGAPDGTSAVARPLYGTPSGNLVVMRGTERAQASQPVNIVQGPRLDEGNSSPSVVMAPGFGFTPGIAQLKVDVTYTIRGWDFVPAANATGLTIRFESRTPATALQNCGLMFEMLTHSLNQIDFRFKKVGTIPDSCVSTSTTTGQYGIQLIASYGGVDRLWYSRALNLTN